MEGSYESGNDILDPTEGGEFVDWTSQEGLFHGADY
jgi:hypothetical protein